MFGQISTLKTAAILTMAAVTFMAITACDAPRSTYFGEDSNSWLRVPVVDHENVYIGVSLLRAQADDTVELVSIEPTGVEGGAMVTGLVSVLGETTTWAGASRESDLQEVGIDLSKYSPVAGFQFSGADGPTALMVRITGSDAITGFRTVKLVFRRNGGETETAEFAVRASICSGSTMAEAIQICQPIADEMNS